MRRVLQSVYFDTAQMTGSIVPSSIKMEHHFSAQLPVMSLLDPTLSARLALPGTGNGKGVNRETIHPRPRSLSRSDVDVLRASSGRWPL